VNRRKVFIGAGAIIASQVCSTAFAQFGPLQRAWVAHPILVQQRCPEWCWAASASMIFAAFGHPIDQKVIVNRIFHQLVCAPAGAAPGGAYSTVASVLSDSWTDDNGDSFTSTIVAAYDPDNGVANIDNAYIVNELAQNRPLLYANFMHAMVVVEADFLVTPAGPNIQSVTVLDPFPANPSSHRLTAAEMVPSSLGGQMRFLAGVQVV
jgi:hypothetical protein